jgi:hypothetical protein
MISTAQFYGGEVTEQKMCDKNHGTEYIQTRCVELILLGLLLSTTQQGSINLKIKNVCSDFLYKFCLKHFSFYEELCKIIILNVRMSSYKVPGMPVRFE